MPQPKDNRVIARLDDEERALLLQVRALTGKSTSGVIKVALRAYAESVLGGQRPLEVFRRHGLVGAVSGPRRLSEEYKQHVDYSDKRG